MHKRITLPAAAAALVALVTANHALAAKGGKPGGRGNPGGGTAPTHYIVDLGTLGGSDSSAWRINEAGQVMILYEICHLKTLVI